jgi:hypothetical protein
MKVFFVKLVMGLFVLAFAYSCAAPPPKVEERKKETTVDDANEALKRVAFFGGKNGFNPHEVQINQADFNEWALTSLPTLIEYADKFATQNYILEVQGHADSAVGKVPNQTLSNQRAQNFYNKLVAAKVPKEKLSYVGKAATDPAVPSEPDARKNRRISFKLVPKK